MENLNEILETYFRKEIEDYEERLSRALRKIDRCHCPLRMASPDLAQEMENCIDEWWEDNRPDPESIIFDE